MGRADPGRAFRPGGHPLTGPGAGRVLLAAAVGRRSDSDVVAAVSKSRPPARPTVASVAQRAQVSPQTVSNALNAPHRVRPATLARVLAAVEELGYRGIEWR